MADDWEGPTPEEDRRINELAAIIVERTGRMVDWEEARGRIMRYFLNGAGVETAFRLATANIPGHLVRPQQELAGQADVADNRSRMISRGQEDDWQELERHPERRFQPMPMLIESEGDVTDIVPNCSERYFVRPDDQLEATTIRLVLDLLSGTRHIHDVARKQADALSYVVVENPSPITPYATLSPLRQLALQALRPGMEYNRNLASSLMDEIASDWGFSWSETPDEPVTEKWILAGGDFTYDPGTHESGVLTQRGEDGVMPIRLYFLLDPSTRVAHGWGLVFNDAGSSQRIRSTPTVRRVLRICDTLGIPLKERP